MREEISVVVSLVKQLRDALAGIEEGYNPETPHMIRCWDKSRAALYAADTFLAAPEPSSYNHACADC